MATSTQINAITALYVGYFDRAPDPAGLQFWIDQIDGGREFNTIAADFAASPEAVALYPYLTTPDVSSPAVFVTNIYANLFDRTPDQEGLDFWTGVLEDGSVSVADMIEAIIMGARDDADAGTFDKSVLDNKVEVGLDFALETGNVPGFEFDAAAKAAAVAAVNGVTEDEATVAQAKAATDAFVAGDNVPGAGDTFTLTTAAGEQIVGTDGNDTFNAIIGDIVGGSTTDDTTLNTFDSVDGGAGKDTLNIISDGDVAVSSAADIENVEIINMFRETVGTNAVEASVFGAAAQELWQINNAGDIEGLAQGQAAGFRGSNINITGTLAGSGIGVAYGAAATAATIALDGIEDSRFEVSGAKLETLTIAGSTNSDAGAETIILSTVGADLPKIETLNVAVENDIVLDLGGSSEYLQLETLDGSGSTGGIELDLDFVSTASLTMDIETATFGSGDDNVTVQTDAFAADDVTADFGAGDDMLDLTMNAAANSSVNMGEGDDEVTLEATTANTGKLDLVLGEGNDKVTIATTDLSNVGSQADFEDSLIVISDFDTDEDTLDVSALSAARDVITNTEQADISAQATLEEALDAAAGYTTGYSVFDYDGDAYVLVNNSGTVLADDDGLIKLAGVSSADLDATAFVG